MSPRKRRAAIVAGTMMLAGLLAACSHTSNPENPEQSASSPPAAAVDPCSVLSSSDIRSALGAPPQAAGHRDNMSVTDDCSWTLHTGGDLHLTFFNPVGAAAFYTPQVSSRRAPDKTYESINGLGDQAVYRDDSSQVISVSESVEVVKGNRHFDVHYVDAVTKGRGPSKDAMASLARTVLAHLH